MTTTTAHAVTIKRIGSSDYGHVAALCSCGWVSPWYSRRTVEGYTLAERDAADHKAARA